MSRLFQMEDAMRIREGPSSKPLELVATLAAKGRLPDGEI